MQQNEARLDLNAPVGWRTWLDAPYDLTLIKQIDSFRNPEVMIRILLLALGSILAGALLDAWLVFPILAAHLCIYGLFMWAVARAPDVLTNGRMLRIASLGLCAVGMLHVGAIYLFVLPDRMAQIMGLALFFGITINTVALRAMEPAFVRTDAWAMFLAAGAITWIEYDRSGASSATLIVAAIVCGHSIYCAIALLQMRILRRTLDAARKGQQAADKQRAIGQLTGGVAHDFNNLLTVVLGNLQLHREIADPAEREALLSEAETAALRGAELTGQLLAFSRKSRLVVQQVTVSDVFAAVAPMIARLLGAQHSLSTGDLSMVPPIRVDVGKLHAVLLNLLLNARDSMPEGGVISAGAYASDVLGRPSVTIFVRDTGRGIPAQDLEQVFEPFFTTKPIGKGSGLGLSMARGFTEQSGGRLEINSVVNWGTEALLHFPQDGMPRPVPSDGDT